VVEPVLHGASCTGPVAVRLPETWSTTWAALDNAEVPLAAGVVDDEGDVGGTADAGRGGGRRTKKDSMLPEGAARFFRGIYSMG